MTRILFCWERGAGLGHLSSLRPFIERAVADGHEVSLAAKDLRHVPRVLGETPVRLLQAPVGVAPKRTDDRVIHSVGMLLGSFYGNDGTYLRSLCRAWGGLFDLVRPELVIYDHSPTALIESLGQSWQKWVIGSGFLIPRTDEIPFGRFPQKPGVAASPDTELFTSDEPVVDVINDYLESAGRTQIDELGDVWRQADRNWLLTLPELDHFGDRPDAMYFGIPPGDFAAKMGWPDRPGPKVVGYLSECAALRPVLEHLDGLPVNGVFYTRDLSAEEIARYPNLLIATEPLDLTALLSEADLMINMGSHKTVAEAYLAGVPQLLIVRHQEQLLLFWRVVSLKAGVGLNASATDVTKPLYAALGLMKKGVSPVPGEYAREMSGARLMREIDAAFSAMKP